ncbi:linear Ubiquitin E3 ligase isoform X11 [Musca autumnalis]|uniref:linear Ubiquitin E3 ligase isoform X11 n=1 Tax=Musca autumnalis TaxID=221902 RepID=UPI003CE75CCA
MALQANNRNLLMRNERTMPAWVTEQSDRIGPKPPPPPLATENGHVTPAPNKQPALPPKTSAQPEPDYEVIEFSNQQYSNTPMRPSSASSGSKTPDTKLKCTLCGSSNPWVMCEECSKQIFCASCDDMFHKHPKRKNHLRKTLEQSNPPLPPKQLPGQPGPTPPVAPPRRNKRGLMTPLMQRKDQVVSAALPVVPPSPTPSMKNASWHERVGSLKRGLSILNRPLPETPKTPTTPSESSRCTTPKSVFDNIQRPPSVVLEKIKNKANATLDRMQMLQQRYRQQKEQMERDRSGYGSEQQRQLALQHHKLAAQRANQLGQRGMSSSVFNLNQASRKPPVMNNGWSNNSMQQAQSMAQLNCANCNHSQQGNWGQPHPMHMNHDPWSNQLSSQQHLNRSNLSLNVGAGYMMPPQHSGMYPPPVFMNQRGMMGQMFAQSYMPGMPVMNPGLVGMPPSASRAASRAGSRMASPALSRKSVTLRRKQRASYHNDEATDDEDSDEDDRRSMVSNRSAMSRTRQRRMSSASQIQMEEDFDSGQQRSRVRSQRRDSVAKSVHNDWAPGRKISTNTTRSGDSGFNSPRQKPAPNRIYSDLDSEGSGTRALVQAKIEQKLKEESLKQQKQTKSKRRSESPPKQKHSMAVQTPVGHNKKKEEIPAEKSATESEAEEDEEEEEEEEEVEEEQNQQELTNAETQEEKHETNNVQPVQENGEVNGTELDVPLEDEDAVSLGPPPSTPDQEWECEFCTFVNEPNIKICTICCKTPSKPPKLVAKSVSPPKQVKPVTTKEQKTGMAKAENTTTTSSPNEKAKPILAKNSTSVSTASLSTTTTTTNNNETTTTSSTNTLKKKESVEDIWAALDENIQATANEVTRKAESASSTSAVAPAKKSNNKVSTACGTSARRSKSASVERHVEESRKSQAREIGTSPPPQTISTQTYETLPLKKMADKEESPSVKPVTVTNGFQDSVQESDLLKYTSEELNAALKYCGPDMHPLIWLRDNWPKLIQTVQSLATKYGQERAENTIGTISQMEAREALRLHTGNIWQAVSECIEQRQRKYREISSKGNFSREDVVTALTTHQGNVEMALLDLGRTQLKPFLMRIWGSPGGVENESGAMIIPPSHNNNESYSMDKVETVLTSTLEKGTLNEHASAEEPSATVAIKAESMPITIDNVLESENSLPELATEIVLAPVTEMLPPQTENSIPELPAEVVLTTETIPENTTASTSSMEVINPSTTDSSSSQIATTSSSTLSSNKDHEKPSTSTTSKESPKLVKSESMEDDNRPSTSKQAAKPKATTNKKKDDSKTTTTTKKTVTASKIPKPNTSQRDQKPKASNEITKENNNSKPKEQPSKEVRTPTVKSKTEPKMILPTRSKSFSGPPTPIVLTSVKTITQRFQTQQKSINSKPQLQKAPTTIARKPSITEAIARLTRPSSSTTTTNTELPTTSSSLFKTRTTPRIPKKKYHETCFSDDDYESTTSEEEPEPIEIRQRKMSVPVFRAYPSVQEPEEVNTEELVDKFVKEELVNTIAEAQIAAALIGMKFQQDVSIWAAKECSDLEHAIALLKQDCELCSGTYALNEIVSMLKCTHKCCKQCAKTYFTVQITERSINDCNCPFCKLPELHNQTEHEDDNLEYFSNLDIFLKNIVEPEVHELFQRKLRDRTLLKDPNFKWCVQCSSGFFARPKQKRLICPDCGSVTCASCRKPWQKQHEGISCEKFLEWEMANDPAVQALGVKEHLDQNGIDCPKCKFRYSLARGGCMHFTCTQCKYEFCYGCAKPFMMGAKCTISPYCAKLGLHAHHPRNCLFYLRDKLPIQLQLLLKNNGVEFEVDPIETNDDSVPESSQKQAPLCPIPIQKETPNGLVDTKCNSDVPDQHAGMCRTHYVEYLTAKVAKAKIDPLPIFDLTDCVQELRRRGIPLPERGPWDTDEIYKGMCAEVIQKNIPLETN